MGTFPQMSTWLSVVKQRSGDGRYEHALARENQAARAAALPRLKLLVDRAHDDARTRLRNLAGLSLDPLGEEKVVDAANGYPEQLHIQTLKGYFGEVMAGLAAENLHPFEHDDWEVPVHLFRYHLVEFQQLDLMHQTGDDAKLRPGRTGDDCLAFRRNGSGDVIAVLFCEAKCTKDHDAGLIADAHEKSSLANLLPVDLLQVIEVLRDSKDAKAERWIDALRKLYLKGSHPGAGCERVDQITYVCGQQPVLKGKITWISTDKPHVKYTAGRRLHVAELQLSTIEELVKSAYGVV
jgi:hypothetical protein